MLPYRSPFLVPSYPPGCSFTGGKNEKTYLAIKFIYCHSEARMSRQSRPPLLRRSGGRGPFYLLAAATNAFTTRTADSVTSATGLSIALSAWACVAAQPAGADFFASR